MNAESPRHTRLRLLTFAGGVAVTLAGGYLLLRVLAFLLAGPETRRTVVPAVPAPGGRYVAAVVEVARGGATVGFFYEVVIGASDAGLDPSRGGTWVWRSYGLAPGKIFWSGPDTIRVVVDRTNEPYFKFIKTRTRHGITAVTDIT